METRNFMLMFTQNRNSHIHMEYYVTESLARKDANELFRLGYIYIELFRKDRGGYRSVKRVDQHEDVAKAKQDAYINSVYQELLDYHHELFG